MYSEQRIVDSRGPLEPNVSAWTDHCRYGGECLELAVGVPNEPLDSLTEEWVRGFAELTAKRTGMGLWTRRLNRVRTRTHSGMAGVGGQPPPMPIKSRCHQQLIRSSRPREPSTARAVSVPLALHCMELAALEAICRKLTTYNYVERWFRIPLSPPVRNPHKH